MLQSTPFARRETPPVLFTDTCPSLQSTPFARRETQVTYDEDNMFMLQSTPFARRETGMGPDELVELLLQSTPFARRETVSRIGISGSLIRASIHSLRKKGDVINGSAASPSAALQSTPFARRETSWNSMAIFLLQCFNPLPSQEGRLLTYQGSLWDYMLQSTPFARRETPFLLFSFF